MKEKEEALKEKERILANAIEGMRGKGIDTGVIASIWGCLKQKRKGIWWVLLIPTEKVF